MPRTLVLIILLCAQTLTAQTDRWWTSQIPPQGDTMRFNKQDPVHTPVFDVRPPLLPNQFNEEDVPFALPADGSDPPFLKQQSSLPHQPAFHTAPKHLPWTSSVRPASDPHISSLYSRTPGDPFVLDPNLQPPPPPPLPLTEIRKPLPLSTSGTGIIPSELPLTSIPVPNSIPILPAQKTTLPNQNPQDMPNGLSQLTTSLVQSYNHALNQAEIDYQNGALNSQQYLARKFHLTQAYQQLLRD